MNSGRHNIKGINFQQWAAMALFLQYLKFNDFEAIHLEAPKSQDFDILFKERKNICEAKDWQGKFSSSHLLKILKGVRGKITLVDNDEILIVGSNINNNLITNINNYKYFENFRHRFETKFKNYSEAELELLPRVRFWQIDKKSLENLVYALFSEIIGFWLPQEELKEKLKAILIDKFYEGSSAGSTYTKSEFLAEIQSISKKAVTKTTLFNDEFRSLGKQFSNLIQDIRRQKKPQWGDYDMSSLSAQPNKMFFVLEQIKAQKFDLQKWEKLWNVMFGKPYYYSLFNIFENNLNEEKNKKYIFKFIKDNIDEVRKFYQREFFDIDVVKTIKKILEDDKDNKFIKEAFKVVNKLITERRDDIFYLKTQRDSFWERSEVAKLLQDIYKKANPQLKEKIYKLIISAFNLTEDDGEFSHYTPQEIFKILKSWLEDEPEKRLPILIRVLSNQYDKFYKKFGKKLEFKGWEHMGGSTSFSGHDYRVLDRHFISFTLEPVLTKYYRENKNKNWAWNFITKHCISKTQRISKSRPDFLNRAVLPIILERYENDDKKISDEAFEILKEFILSRKGIPHKSDLIYQALKGRAQLSDSKIWKLVKTSMDKYGVPINVFIEEIVSSLAKRGNLEAKKALRDWLKNPEYYKKFRFETNIIQNIRTVFDNSFDYAVTLFEDFINSDYFVNKQDSFETYEAAVLLYDILGRYLEQNRWREGLKIIDGLLKQKTLTKNQQIILCFSLFNHRGNDQLDNIKLLIKVYEEFINPFLSGLNNNINTITKKLTFSQAREALVQFAERLAQNKKIKESLRIVKVFMNDSDPYLPGKDPEDPENKYNEHQGILNGKEPGTITSVRGWCAWVLMKCSVLDGRPYIDEIIKRTKTLVDDENYYVKHMACFPLSMLAKQRLTHLSDNSDILFLDDNKEKALKKAKEIEDVAFNLLTEISSEESDNIKNALAKSILHVFDDMRALNETRTREFVEKFEQFSPKAIAEAVPLFIFFAEFRKNAFKDWRWKMPNLYDDLGSEKFDDKYFEAIINGLIKNNDENINSQFAWHFWSLVHTAASKNAFEIAYKYLPKLAEEYNHQVFVNIYMFIQDNIANKPQECYELWKKCLTKERPFLENEIKNDRINEISWWPCYNNGDILIAVKQKIGDKEFLDSFKFLSGYPNEVNFGNINKAADLLVEIPGKEVKTILKNLIEKNPIFYDLLQKWEKNTKKKN